VAQCEEVAKNGSGDSVRKSRRGYTARIGEDVFLQPFFEDRRNQRDQQKTPNPKQKLFKPFGHRALLVSTFVTDGQLYGFRGFLNSLGGLSQHRWRISA